MTSILPNIGWIEGLFTLLRSSFPHEQNDPRVFGFQMGKQLLSLYAIELLIKYELEKLELKYGASHNLIALYEKLPLEKRNEAGQTYQLILKNQKEWTWDVAESIESLLQYLGKNAITDTRYFWEPGRSRLVDNASILMMPDILQVLVYSLVIALHKYPYKQTGQKYNTIFMPLKPSLEQQMSTSRSARRQSRNNIWKPNVVWMEGVLTLIDAAFPYGPEDSRRLGFAVGRQFLCLHVIEIILKSALDNRRLLRHTRHNLLLIFKKLPPNRRHECECIYRSVLESNTEWTWDIAESVESFLKYLGKTAITDTRYFWDPNRTHVSEDASILFMPEEIRNLLYALFMALHQYPSQPIKKKFDTTFRSLEKSLKEERIRPDNEEK